MNLDIIKNYIIEHYPESCLACNIQRNPYTSEELKKECENFFYYEQLNWCGCGDPDIAKSAIKDYLQCVYDWQNDKSDDSYINNCKRFQARFGVESVYDDRLLLCLAYELDTARLTDHGSSIGCAWLTKEGEMFLWLLNQNEELQEEEQEHCEFCEKFDFSKAKIVDEENITTIALGICNTKFPKEEQFNYCPKCGRKL